MILKPGEIMKKRSQVRKAPMTAEKIADRIPGKISLVNNPATRPPVPQASHMRTDAPAEPYPTRDPKLVEPRKAGAGYNIVPVTARRISSSPVTRKSDTTVDAMRSLGMNVPNVNTMKAIANAVIKPNSVPSP
jgi:hypothetical protein